MGGSAAPGEDRREAGTKGCKFKKRLSMDQVSAVELLGRQIVDRMRIEKVPT